MDSRIVGTAEEQADTAIMGDVETDPETEAETETTHEETTVTTEDKVSFLLEPMSSFWMFEVGEAAATDDVNVARTMDMKAMKKMRTVKYFILALDDDGGGVDVDGDVDVSS